MFFRGHKGPFSSPDGGGGNSYGKTISMAGEGVIPHQPFWIFRIWIPLNQLTSSLEDMIGIGIGSGMMMMMMMMTMTMTMRMRMTMRMMMMMFSSVTLAFWILPFKCLTDFWTTTHIWDDDCQWPTFWGWVEIANQLRSGQGVNSFSMFRRQ